MLSKTGSDADCLASSTSGRLSHRSSAVEKVLEYQFLALLGRELWLRNMDFDVLRSDVDNNGHDLVIEAGGTVRHIQLKAMVKGGKRADVTVNTRLAAKASGCVIWMIWDPETLELGPFRWFGGEPGMPLPDPGGKIARHTKGTSKGEKNERPEHRVIRRGQFEKLDTIAELADRLFGAEQ